MVKIIIIFCSCVTLLAFGLLSAKGNPRGNDFELKEVWEFEIGNRSIDAVELAISPDGSKFAIFERETNVLRMFRRADQEQLWEKQLSDWFVWELVFSNNASTLCIYDKGRSALLSVKDGSIVGEHDSVDLLSKPCFDRANDSPNEVYFSSEPAGVVKVDYKTGEETQAFSLEDYEEKFPEVMKWVPEFPLGSLDHFDISQGHLYGFQKGYLFRYDLEMKKFHWINYLGNMPTGRGPLFVTPGDTLTCYLSKAFRPACVDLETGEVNSKLELPNSELLRTANSELYFLLDRSGVSQPTRLYIVDQQGNSLLKKEVLWKSDSDGRASISSDGKFLLTAQSKEGVCVLWQIVKKTDDK